MGWGSSWSDWSAPVIGAVTGGALGGPGGAITGAATGLFASATSPEGAPDPGLPPTEADIAKQEADKAALRRQRAAALLAGGQRANILTSPLGVPGGSQAGESQGRKTLLGM